MTGPQCPPASDFGRVQCRVIARGGIAIGSHASKGDGIRPSPGSGGTETARAVPVPGCTVCRDSTHHVALLLVAEAGLQLSGGGRVGHLTQYIGDLVAEQRTAAPQACQGRDTADVSSQRRTPTEQGEADRQ